MRKLMASPGLIDDRAGLDYIVWSNLRLSRE
jgi:hypothetical protein